jgi:hypothetical protein
MGNPHGTLWVASERDDPNRHLMRISVSRSFLFFNGCESSDMPVDARADRFHVLEFNPAKQLLFLLLGFFFRFGLFA